MPAPMTAVPPMISRKPMIRRRKAPTNHTNRPQMGRESRHQNNYCRNYSGSNKCSNNSSSSLHSLRRRGSPRRRRIQNLRSRESD